MIRTWRNSRALILALAGLALVWLTLLSPAVTAQAATSRTIPIHFLRSADCTGEVVEISGTIHLVSQVQSDGSVVGHFNYQAVTAVGLSSGNTYLVSAVDHFRLSEPFPSSISSVRVFHLISQGDDSNLLVTGLYHITVNASGEIAATIDTLSMQCT